MFSDKIILSMTTWPPRFSSAIVAMSSIIQQRKNASLTDDVHCVIVLSEEEVCSTSTRSSACRLIDKMEKLGVEVIIDKGNIRSHKKLIPTLEKYPNNPILVVDDDSIQREGWLKTFVDNHRRYPDAIIYGQSRSRISICNGEIREENSYLTYGRPGESSIDLKPASGASGTLYPAHTFTDERFFDRELMMRVSPSSDETWQWAFAIINRSKFRCLSSHNLPYSAGANQECALYHTNRNLYNKIHNDIANAIPEYYAALEEALG